MRGALYGKTRYTLRLKFLKRFTKKIKQNDEVKT